MTRKVEVFRSGKGFMVIDKGVKIFESPDQSSRSRSRVRNFLIKQNLEATQVCINRFSWLRILEGEINSKFDLYKTAKVKDSGMVPHGGEYVRVLGHLNETLIHVEFLNGDKKYYHKCHLENFVL